MLSDADLQKAAPEIPSKFISDTISVDLKASVFYVDMDGIHDGQAIKTIIADLQPRKLVSGTEISVGLPWLIGRSSYGPVRSRRNRCWSIARRHQSRKTSSRPRQAKR